MNILPWPAKSADLNLIEHIWNELDNRLKKEQCNHKQEQI